MAILVLDPEIECRLIIKSLRRESDSDRHDEVWDGLYVIAPLRDNEHQAIQAGFITTLYDVLGWDHPAKIRPGVNIGDRGRNWEKNYRAPDVVVFLPGTRAMNCSTHWRGGPEFLVEIITPFDCARDKLAFYGKVGCREVILVDRDPWVLELYAYSVRTRRMRLRDKTEIGGSALGSSVLPLAFSIVPGKSRPRIKVALNQQAAGSRSGRSEWLL